MLTKGYRFLVLFIFGSFWFFMGVGPFAAGAGIGTVNHVKLNRIYFALEVLAVILVWLIYYLLKTKSAYFAKPVPLAKALYGIPVASILAIVIYQTIPLKLFDDFHAYLLLGHQIFTHGWTSFVELDKWRPPGMAILLGTLLKAGLSDLSAIWVINTCSMMACYFVFKKLLKNIQSSRATVLLMGITLACALPWIVMVSYSEIPSFALTIGVMALIPTYKKQLSELKISHGLLAGLLIGFATLLRPQLILLIPLITGILLLKGYSMLGNARTQMKKLVIYSCLMWAGAFLMIIPVTIRNYQALHRFVPISTNGGEVFYSANRGHSYAEQGRYMKKYYYELRAAVPDDVTRNSEGFKRGLKIIAKQPVLFIASFPWRLVQVTCRCPATFAIYFAQCQSRLNFNLAIYGPLFLLLLAEWSFWLKGYLCRHRLRMILDNRDYIPWIPISFIVILLVSLIFECAGRYMINFLPFLIFLFIEAESQRSTDLAKKVVPAKKHAKAIS